MSWIAEFVFAESLLGAEYATVTGSPPSTAADNVNTIVVPGVVGLVTVEIVTGELLTFTTKSLKDAVAAARASENVRVNVVPFAANVGRATRLRSGRTVSMVEPFTTA